MAGRQTAPAGAAPTSSPPPPSESASAQPDSVDKVPFALVTALFATLRSVGSSAAAARPRPGSSRADAATRRQHLTRFWLDAASHTTVGRESLRARSTTTSLVPAHVLPPRDALRLLALLVPALDPVHVYLGMKETRLADAFRRALDLAPDHPHAVWLARYKERAVRPPAFRDDPNVVDGSLPSVLRAVLTDRCPKQGSLSVGDVWHVLDVLSSTFRVRTRRIARVTVKETPDGAQAVQESAAAMEERRSDALRSLITHGTADDVAEVSRVILKDADVRVSVDSFLNWLHPSAKQHYAQVHDVSKLLKDCHDPSFDIADAAVAPGQFASVMLCMRPSRKNLPAICEKLRGDGDGRGGSTGASGTDEASGAAATAESGTDAVSEKQKYFFMEPKLDGERLQLHKWKAVTEQSPEDGQAQTTASSASSADDFVLKTYSRRGNDSSAMYAGALRSVIQTAVRARDIILDGEVIIWDEAKATWLPFEKFRDVTTQVAERRVARGAQYVLKYMVFDVLYVDQGAKQGKLNAAAAKRAAAAVMRLPLYKRRLVLEKLIRPTEQAWCPGARVGVELVRAERGRAEGELTAALQRYETLGYEGAIGKNPDLPYVLGERSLELAIKLKPDYFDGGVQDIDAIILGGKYSTSSGHRIDRAGNISSFLIGVRADDAPIRDGGADGAEADDGDGAARCDTTRTKWVPLGSVGSGYSDSELRELREKLDGAWRPLDRRNLPDHLAARPAHNLMLQQVAVWLAPRDSVVLTVRAFELNRGLCALRFPRVQRVRWDKDWRDASTFGDVLDADDAKPPPFVRADERDVDDVAAADARSGAGPPAAKRRRRDNADSQTTAPDAAADAALQEQAALAAARADGHVVSGGRAARAVIATGRGADVRAVAVVCDALRGVVVCVVGGDARRKHAAERRVHELGGRFVQALTDDVDTVVVAGGAGAEGAREAVQRVDAAGRADAVSVVRAAWVDACYAARARVDPSGRDVVRASAALRAKVFAVTDRFGDAWRTKTTAASFTDAAAAVAEWRDGLQQGGAAVPQRAGARSDADDAVDAAFAHSSERRFTVTVDAEVKRRSDECAKEMGLLFRGMRVHTPADLGVAARGAAAVLRAHGASEAEELEIGVTHVLVHSSVEDEWRERCANEGGGAEVVTEKWVFRRLRSGGWKEMT